ncbi:hypothetical protein H4P12_08255 [Paracoccus sp. 11-3]|uniref:Uncharacterized protein n=1 Tax=Paracoccus amoyensis TaxID=2760093 RepID=A0A926G6H1_9RHOB|nr:hypothetical protein [Paracoccus amoyensis]MBC9246703.1 hypothetical protein [Paracoccus amoyensis]
MMVETYFVDVICFGESVDIMPTLQAAIERCPYKHDFTVSELAELVEWTAGGKYIPVDTLDRIEGRNLGSITGWVIQRIQSEQRILQVIDPGVRKLRPYIELLPGVHYCKAVEDYYGRWLQPKELVPLPMEQCDCDRCSCQYHAQGRFDVEERGAKPRDPG